MILQRIRDAEREMKYEEYAGSEGDIVTGIIQQTDQRYTLLDLGRVEALLPQAEQVQNERYEHGSRLKAYIVEVRKTAKGPQIVVSRTHPGLVKRLFELEVPEIVDGVVEHQGDRPRARSPHEDRGRVQRQQRRPGRRVRRRARSRACGMVVNELRGEKVDIVPYTDDSAEFVQKALAPARVREVRIHEDTGTAEVIVPDFQLSLAIGKEGQNARLAARLSGWRVDIKSETQLQEEETGEVDYAEGEWVKNDSGELVFQPAEGGETISAAEAGYASPGGRARGGRDARRRSAASDATATSDVASAAEAAAARRRRPPSRRALPRSPRARRGAGEPARGGEGGERRVSGAATRFAPASGVAAEHRRASSCVSATRPATPIELGAGAGRGAWLCAPPRIVECFDEAVRRAAFGPRAPHIDLTCRRRAPARETGRPPRRPILTTAPPGSETRQDETSHTWPRRRSASTSSHESWASPTRTSWSSRTS